MADPQHELTYRERVVHGALTAVVEAGAMPGAEGGVIDIEEAVEALCAVLGTLIMKSGAGETQKMRRANADHCREAIMRTMRGIEAGAPIDWDLSPVSAPH